MPSTYHHRDLRADLLHRACSVIVEDGAAELSLRSLARAAGVSHAAPRHHFATRSALITALAAEGFNALAQRLQGAAHGGDFVEVAVAYVQFAADFPAHFDVMFRPDLLDRDEPALLLAQQGAFGVLRAGVDAKSVEGTSAAVADAAVAVVAGWSLVHGLASLAASGSLDGAHLPPLLPDQDLAAITRRTAGMLFGSAPSAPLNEVTR